MSQKERRTIPYLSNAQRCAISPRLLQSELRTRATSIPSRPSSRQLPKGWSFIIVLPFDPMRQAASSRNAAGISDYFICRFVSFGQIIDGSEIPAIGV